MLHKTMIATVRFSRLVSISGSVSTVRFGHDANRAIRISGTENEPDGVGLGWTGVGGGFSIDNR